MSSLKVVLNINAYHGKGRPGYYKANIHFRDMVYSRISKYPRDEKQTEAKREYRENVLKDIYFERRFSLYKFHSEKKKLVYISRTRGASEATMVDMFRKQFNIYKATVTSGIVITRIPNRGVFSGHIVFPDQDEMVALLETEFAKLLSYPVGHPLGIQVTNDLPGKNGIKNSFKRPQACRNLYGKDYSKTDKGTVHRFTPYGPVGSGEETVGTDPRQVLVRRMSQRLERLCRLVTSAFRAMKMNNPAGFRDLFGDDLTLPDYNTVEFKTYVSGRVKRTVLCSASNGASNGATYASDRVSKHADRQNRRRQIYTHANTQKKNTAVVTFSLGGPRELVFSRKGEKTPVTFDNVHGTSFLLDPRDEELENCWSHDVPPITDSCGVSFAAVLRPNFATVQVHKDSSLQVECPRIVEKLQEPYRDTTGLLATRREHYDREAQSLKEFTAKHGNALAEALRQEFGKYFEC